MTRSSAAEPTPEPSLELSLEPSAAPPLGSASLLRFGQPADLLALDLEPDAPLDVRAGRPRASVRELYRDATTQSGVWAVTPGRFAGTNEGFGELMVVLAGVATVTGDDGVQVELSPGVTFVARPGWRGEWDVRETVRKVYLIWTV
jgi:uncharacterized cupin superfamily protein